MRRLSLLVLMLMLAGCAAKAKIAPVSGRITLDGVPLANANITFQPIGSNDPGPGSYGRSDADGRYTLNLVSTDESGAIVGNHRVMISTLGGQQVQMSDGGMKLPKDRVPRRYNTETRLTFEVPAQGSNAADFTLTFSP